MFSSALNARMSEATSREERVAELTSIVGIAYLFNISLFWIRWNPWQVVYVWCQWVVQNEYLNLDVQWKSTNATVINPSSAIIVSWPSSFLVLFRCPALLIQFKPDAGYVLYFDLQFKCSKSKHLFNLVNNCDLNMVDWSNFYSWSKILAEFNHF